MNSDKSRHIAFRVFGRPFRFFAGCVVVLLVVSLPSCATSRPWMNGLPQESRYYYQGTGLNCANAEQAKRYAVLDLIAHVNGREVAEQITDLQTANSQVENRRVETLQKNTWDLHVTTRLRGRVDAGAQIVEVFERGGLYSAYAIARKKGVDRQLNAEFERKIYGLKARALVPGWAQLQKNEHIKARRILSIAVVSGLTGIVSSMFQSEFEARRRHATTAVDYDYYDMLAQRSYWTQVGAAVVFSTNYLYSTIDGLFTLPAPYKVLIGYQPGHGVHAGLKGRVTLAYEF
jgi:hypothetical protein